jgi:DNA replication protein DnaC
MNHPGKLCPYIRDNVKDRDTVCTGTQHLRPNLPPIPCPLWEEASLWARHAGIRGSFELTSFQSQYQPDAYEAVQAWVQNPKGLLLLASPPGRGKSHLAVGAWYALRRRLHPAIFTSSVFFQSLSQQAARGEDEGAMAKFVGENLLLCHSTYFEEASVEKPFTTPVIFDDLGSERTTDTMIDYTERLLNYHDCMLITTNLDMESIREKYQERIASRLMQAQPSLWLEGPDWRSLGASNE